MFHFGFSYVGLIYLLMLFIPNGIWAKNQPKDYEQYVKNENKVLQIFERVGEVLVCCFVLIFSDFNIRFNSIWCLWLAVSFLFMLLYELYWLRYFRSEKTMADFYSSICGVPVAGATLPVCAFFLLGIYGCNIFLIVSVVILGIGHIGIHLNHYKEIHENSGAVKKKGNIARGIMKWVILVVCVIVFGLIAVIIGCRNVNYMTHYINPEQGVDEGVYIPLGGQEQYLLIRGRNVENPVMIWLHGGPSSPDAMVNYIFQNDLIDDYTIINWEQRGCGRTYFRNMKKDPANETVSFEQAQSDLDALVDYACERFGTEKVIIVGHSYGTMLGSRYVLNHPEKVSAYIGVGQLVTMKSEFYSYEDALAKATAAGDDTSAMEAAYEKLVEDQSLTNMMDLRKLVNKYHVAEKEANTILQALVSPYMGVDDVRWFLLQAGDFNEYIKLNQGLMDYMMVTDVRDYGLAYRVPVGFISGSDDWTTPVKYSEDYCNSISAPQKKFALLEGCGHSPQYGEPEEFSDILHSMLNEFGKSWS